MKRCPETGRILRAPIKVGDLVACRALEKFRFNELGIIEHKAYKVVATELSAEKNRISFGMVYPHPSMTSNKRPGFFIIDEDGCKRFMRLGSGHFGLEWIKINNRG